VVYALCGYFFGWTPQEVDEQDYDRVVKLLIIVMRFIKASGDLSNVKF
jgi:hypothetical protein